MKYKMFPLQLTDDFNDSPLFGKKFKDWFNCDELGINYSWDLITAIEKMILNYFERKERMLHNGVSDDFHVIGDKNRIYAKGKVLVEGKTIINTSKGPVIFGENVSLRNFNSIEGPCYIGDNSTIDSGVLRGPFICGKVCKLSGEIEESYLMDYVNKHHYGFIGHSAIGSWVNLGAGTTNSDLKNNYSTVRMFDGEQYIDTKRIKAGCIIGDHVKTAIGTMINTGTVIGPFANIFEDIRTVKYVKPFSWGGNNETYDMEKMIENIAKVMNRRGVEPSEDYVKRVIKAYSDFSL